MNYKSVKIMLLSIIIILIGIYIGILGLNGVQTHDNEIFIIIIGVIVGIVGFFYSE